MNLPEHSTKKMPIVPLNGSINRKSFELSPADFIQIRQALAVFHNLATKHDKSHSLEIAADAIDALDKASDRECGL